MYTCVRGYIGINTTLAGLYGLKSGSYWHQPHLPQTVLFILKRGAPAKTVSSMAQTREAVAQKPFQIRKWRSRKTKFPKGISTTPQSQSVFDSIRLYFTSPCANNVITAGNNMEKCSSGWDNLPILDWKICAPLCETCYHVSKKNCTRIAFTLVVRVFVEASAV